MVMVAEDSAPRNPAGRRRSPAASMDLLKQIVDNPVDPDYAAVAARGAPPSRLRWRLAVTVALAAVLFTSGLIQTTRTAPQAEQEREDLIARIRAAEAQQDGLRDEIAALTAELNRLRTGALGGGAAASATRTRITALEAQVGVAAVTGPGLVITVDDSTTITDIQGRVLDIDLQQLANGLWMSGAEAISINDQRLTSLTAIRGAGEAITVNYRSLTRPYRIVVIGDPATLSSRLAESPGGQWWIGLQQNLGMVFRVDAVDEVVVPGDASATLRYARRKP